MILRLQTSRYAYLDVRLTGLGVQLEAERDARERYVMLYSGLSELVDYLPEAVRPFLEWWMMKNDFENIKDTFAQMLGNLRYEIWRPSIRVPKDQLIGFSQTNEIDRLLDFLSRVLEDFDSHSFEGSKTYVDFAYHLDQFYYVGFASRVPSKPDNELAWKLVHLAVDAKNTNLLGRTKSPDRFFLPYGLLEVRDLLDAKRLSEVLAEQYGVRNPQELPEKMHDACSEYSSDFGKTMEFITYQEQSIREAAED